MFAKNRAKRKKQIIWSFGTFEEEKTSIKFEVQLRFWQKIITIGNANQRRRIFTKHEDKAPLLNKKNECPTISTT